MSKNFDWLNIGHGNGPTLWLKIAAGALALLNAVALFLFLAPPGGSRHELLDQDASIRRNIQAHRISTERLKTVSAKVQLGGDQTEKFASKYFLPNRTAFTALMGELLRMSNAAGLREGQRTYSQEPIEGTDDLTLLTINANYQGNYADLMKFLNEVDHSDHLLILDTLTATPQQQGTGVLNVVARFLAVLREDGSTPGAISGGQQ
jgi:Tfp pilus assembly protein PilO